MCMAIQAGQSGPAAQLHPADGYQGFHRIQSRLRVQGHVSFQKTPINRSRFTPDMRQEPLPGYYRVDFTEALDGAEQSPATSDPIGGGWGRGLAGRRRRRRRSRRSLEELSASFSLLGGAVEGRQAQQTVLHVQESAGQEVGGHGGGLLQEDVGGLQNVSAVGFCVEPAAGLRLTVWDWRVWLASTTAASGTVSSSSSLLAAGCSAEHIPLLPGLSQPAARSSLSPLPGPLPGLTQPAARSAARASLSPLPGLSQPAARASLSPLPGPLSARCPVRCPASLSPLPGPPSVRCPVLSLSLLPGPLSAARSSLSLLPGPLSARCPVLSQPAARSRSVRCPASLSPLPGPLSARCPVPSQPAAQSYLSPAFSWGSISFTSPSITTFSPAEQRTARKAKCLLRRVTWAWAITSSPTYSGLGKRRFWCSRMQPGPGILLPSRADSRPFTRTPWTTGRRSGVEAA
ncbi:hypothetical protein CRUP_012737 [Coryphaenoides rupestris]|nr:hypothetical protein CRUP_012737 [Coryphaenoides rupestris]